MKAYTDSTNSKNTYLAILNRLRRLDLLGRVAIFMILIALVVSGAFRNSSASRSKDTSPRPLATGRGFRRQSFPDSEHIAAP
jgi:hypothetical protein